MGPPLYTRSVIGRNVFMQRRPVYITVCMCMNPATSHECGAKWCYADGVVQLKYFGRKGNTQSYILTWEALTTAATKMVVFRDVIRSELSYLAPLGSENISTPYFKQCFFRGEGYYPPQNESNTTPPSPKTEITNISFYILNFASIIKFEM